MDNVSYSEIIAMVLNDVRERIINNHSTHHLDREDDNISAVDDIRSSMDRATAEAYILTT